jgi:hypothetical protein
MHPPVPLQKTLAALSLGSALAGASACPVCVPGVSADGYAVHEWGTFTTLSASDGRPLGGLYVDATRLPAFVGGVPFFNYDSAQGWASLGKLRNVTVKMETPVLYFYSQKERDVDVKVRFNGGTISQWYPQCYVCEADPSGRSVDFAKEPYAGRIGWRAKVLAPGGTPLPYSTAASGQETAEWTAPRDVPSNRLRGEKGEIEQFLFYRGLGNFPSTVKLAFSDDSTFTVANDGDEDLPWVMVYDRDYLPGNMPPAAVWFQGPLKAHAKAPLKRSPAYSPDNPASFSDAYAKGAAAMDSLLNHMVAAGLTLPEGRALLNTWYNGYFIEGGLKAFWILPRAMVDRILPLDITPAPDVLERVIVGRSEILPPPFERILRQALADDTLSHYAKDKYRMAFQDLLNPGKDWSGTTALAPYPGRDAASFGRAEGGHRPASAVFDWGKAGIVDALGRPLPPAFPSAR